MAYSVLFLSLWSVCKYWRVVMDDFTLIFNDFLMSAHLDYGGCPFPLSLIIWGVAEHHALASNTIKYIAVSAQSH